jgi:L-cystine uptake protein TcyP (sodium:dicarboxylate symporter family)
MHWEGRDSVLVAATCAALLVIRAVDLPQALGNLLLGVAP